NLAGRPGRREAGDVGVGRVRDTVTDDEGGERPGRGVRAQGQRVLVAPVAFADVAHAGHPRRRLLGVVVAGIGLLRTAGVAVAVQVVTVRALPAGHPLTGGRIGAADRGVRGPVAFHRAGPPDVERRLLPTWG